MAATYDINKLKQAAGVVNGTQDIGNPVNNRITLPDYATNRHYTGLPGASGQTQAQLGKYTQGYTPSQSVTAAQDYLNSVVSGKPGAYKNNYKQQLDDLYNQVMNRPKFSYDLNGDMLYRQYRDQYMNLGNQAMMDTTAQAAALTGGYGNSYAATAGNQAYQAYLQQLNNVVPDLYQMALQRYQQEGDDLNTRYGMTAELENQDYGRYQQDLANWQAEREAANADYWNQYNADYGQYADQMDYWSQMAAQENAQWNTNRELAYNQAMAIIKTGKTPSAALLATAGISAADAKTLAKAYAPKSSSGGGSSRKSSSGGGYTPQPTQDNDEVYKPSQKVNDMVSAYQYEVNYEGRLRSGSNGSGGRQTSVEDEVRNKVKKGEISKADGAYILSRI